MSNENHDYTTSDAQRHHKFYIPTGDIVFQAEKTVYRVHRHFLTTQSSVFNDMLTAPKDQISNDGTEDNPLLLSGDRVEGWELLLSAFYRRNPLKPVKYTSKESIAVLRITHKYCTDIIEPIGIERGSRHRRTHRPNGSFESCGFVLLVQNGLERLNFLVPQANAGGGSTHWIGGMPCNNGSNAEMTIDTSKPCNCCGAVGTLSVYCHGCARFQL